MRERAIQVYWGAREMVSRAAVGVGGNSGKDREARDMIGRLCRLSAFRWLAMRRRREKFILFVPPLFLVLLRFFFLVRLLFMGGKLMEFLSLTGEIGGGGKEGVKVGRGGGKKRIDVSFFVSL